MRCLLCGSEEVTKESSKYRLCVECVKALHNIRGKGDYIGRYYDELDGL